MFRIVTIIFGFSILFYFVLSDPAAVAKGSGSNWTCGLGKSKPNLKKIFRGVCFRTSTHKSAKRKEPRPPIERKGSINLSRDIKNKKKDPVFLAKRNKFYVLLHNKYNKQKNEFIMLIKRSNILQDSYEIIMQEKTPLNLLGELNVLFIGETSNDNGGVTKEWVSLLAKEIFNPSNGFFKYSNESNFMVEIDPAAIPSNYFEFIGRVTGMALYRNILLDVSLSKPFLKAILGRKVSYEDIQYTDLEIYNSMMAILKSSNPSEFELRFVLEVLGPNNQIIEYPLEKNGSKIPVKNKNKAKYISLLVEYKYVKLVEKQMSLFLKGFRSLIPQNFLEDFDELELELMLCGVHVIDVDDWENNTRYLGGYDADSKPVQWFWQAIRSFSNEQRLTILQFVTGSTRVPANGFAEFQKYDKIFTINKLNKSNTRFPQAHTCSSILDLPPYTSYMDLEEKLKTVLLNPMEFTIE